MLDNEKREDDVTILYAQIVNSAEGSDLLPSRWQA
jgi:hypothetical protein